MTKDISSLLLFSWLGLFCYSFGQENAGSSIAPALRECYNTSIYLDTESRLPSSVNILIDLIRKVENGASQQDMREYAIEFLHRFRQDGVVKTVSSSSQFSIPYSPILMQADKNRILLKKLVPGSAILFPNETLNSLELCSLHFMLSNTIELGVRGDEGTVCNKLSQYQRRFRRSSRINRDDVEIFDPKISKLTKGNIENDGDDNEDVPPEEVPNDPLEDGSSPPEDVETIAKSTSTIISSCPVEKGVVYSKWGSLQAGTVLAGIAAGLNTQSISSNGYTIDNRYAATLAGDLSEAALHQGTRTGSVTTGTSGGWNSTVVPRWYFMERAYDWEMTDAEIRAGLDGLILGLNIQSWYSSFSSLKLSQVLDMYYSPRGVLNTTMRACNRKNLLTTVAPEDTLVAQTTGFSYELDDYATLSGTLSEEGVVTYSTSVTSDFLTYAPQLNDVTCMSEGETVQRTSTDIIIVLDVQWSFTVVRTALSYLLDNLDVNIYDGSNYTIINGYDGSIMLNTSNTIVDFHQYYNLSVHNNFTSGFEFRSAFNEVERIARARMDNSTGTLSSGGQSLIALFVPYTQTISESDQSWISERKQIFKSYVPDLRLLVLGRSSTSSYSSLVFDSSNDIFILPESSDTTTITTAISSLVTRIKEIPRRIVNPKCGSEWSGDSSSNSFYQYIEPTNINYYKISPNYFYGDGTRTLKIKGTNSVNTFVICYSRTVPQPSQNSSSTGDDTVSCETISSTNELSLSLTNGCDGHSLISSCPPYYFSIALSTEIRSFQCTDPNCRFPDNAKVTISHEGFVCRSGSLSLTWTFSVILIFTLHFLS